MSVALSYPGVYIEEIPSGVRTIVSVPTSVTAFIGRTNKGPVGIATDITSWLDFERKFGGLWQDSQLSFAVRDFYLNGGSRAVIVRLFQPTYGSDATKAAALKAAADNAVADLKKEMIAAGIDTGKKVKEALKEKLGPKDGSKAGTKRSELKKIIDDSKDNPNDDAKKLAASNAEAAKKAVEAVAVVINRLDDAAKDEEGKTPIADTIALAERTALSTDKRELILDNLTFEAISPGKWGGYLRLIAEPGKEDVFNLTITDASPGGASETFLNLTVANGPRFIGKVLENESNLLRWKNGATPPNFNNGIETDTKKNPGVKLLGDEVGVAFLKVVKAHNENPNPKDEKRIKAEEDYKKAIELTLASVSDGDDLTIDTFLPNPSTIENRGLKALDQLYARDGIFNLLCIPPYLKSDAEAYVDPGVIAAAAAYCEEKRAILIVDPPKKWTSIDAAKAGINAEFDQVGTTSKNAAIFFPRIKQANPLRDNQIEEFAPCGVVAGIIARTDTERGVWKAPAGIEASLKGVSSLDIPMTDLENGLLNPLGINCLRHFPIYGKVVWGSRTLQGADGRVSEWKYLPVMRTALFIEESLFRATKWVIFQENHELLWERIRSSVDSFMHNLFRQGAFQGRSPQEAYFVKCDADTTTETDVRLGIVNFDVGFSPLYPAEFVVIRFQQKKPGQIEV